MCGKDPRPPAPPLAGLLQAARRAEPQTLTALLAARIAASGPATALVDATERLSYAGLDRRADGIAARLAAAGVRRGHLVAVLLDRSATMVAAWLAVLRLGAAYLPLDPAYPEARLRLLIDDSGAGLVITEARTAALADVLGVRTVEVGPADGVAGPCEAPAGHVTPDDAAYVIYTSGSTGTPKGVVVEHRNIANTVAWFAGTMGLEPGDPAGQSAAAGFDVAGMEIWGSLLSGAALHLPAEPVRRSPRELCRWIVEHGLVAVGLITPVAVLALRHGWLEEAERLRTLYVGGDKLHVRPPERAGYRLLNLYGPTETAVVATGGVVAADRPGAEAPGAPTIGRPIANATAYVLDENGAHVPDGVDGELFIGGAGVARGYLGRPDLTRERFVADPFRPGGRLYRTGDLVRRRSDGELEFRGRADDQVKIGGFRVELGEIEAALRRHPAVGEAAVKLWEPEVGYPRLVGYFSGTSEQDSEAVLKWLATRLPAHMVPAVLIPLDAFPLTAHQKIDRGALPDPDPSELIVEWTDPAERELADDWRLACGVIARDADDTLVALGAGSLDLIALRVRVGERLGFEVPAAALTLTQRLREQARLIGGLEPGRAAAAPGAREGLGAVGQEALVFLEELNGSSMGYQYQMVLDGPGAPDPQTLEKALRAVTLAQPALACRYRMTGRGLVASPGPEADVRLDVHDAGPGELDALLARLVARPIAYDDFPLVRWDLVRHPGGSLLLQREHHLIHDGWSVGVFMDQLMAAYAEGRAAGNRGETYFDWALRQRTELASASGEEHRRYWRGQYALLDGACQTEPSGTGPTRSADLLHALGAARSAEVDRVAASVGVTAFALLLATFRRLMGAGLIGSSQANRDPSTLDVVGLFVNVLPLIRTTGDETPAEAARAEMALIAAAAKHQIPTNEVLRLAPAGLGLAERQLYPVMFSKHDSPLPRLRFGAWEPELRELPNGFGKTGLSVVVKNRGLQHARDARRTGATTAEAGDYELRWAPDLDRWSEAAVRDAQRRYVRLLDAVLRHPHQPWPDATSSSDPV
ncbi:amino acid adenylation domain-containing protein [Catenulispora subtropica]